MVDPYILAFGKGVGSLLNGSVNRELAEGDEQDILEVVLLESFTDGAIEVLSSKKGIKLFLQNSIWIG